MIRYVGCDYARPRLDAFADGELPMGDQVLVETHLRWCQTCAARIEDAQTIGDSLRLSARAHAHQHAAPQELAGGAGDVTGGIPGDLGQALAAMQAEVVAQADTEYEQSLDVRMKELFSDMRLWWPALGATVAVVLSVGVAGNIWKAASSQQPASLAAMIENLADPGSNRNPQRLDAAMYLPRVLDDGAAFDSAMLAQYDGEDQPDELLAIPVVLTREGKIVSGNADGEMQGVLHAVRRSRFAPAQRPGGRVVAVNMVLLFAHTTVKASHETIDLGTPLTRPVLTVRPPVAKPASLAPEDTTSQENSQETSEGTVPAPIESASV